MSSDTHSIVAREGWVHIAVVIAIAVVLSVFNFYLGVIGWLGVVFVVQFFRDPHRNIPQDDGVVVSPADGRVLSVGPAVDPERKISTLKISIFMNVFNVHSNRAPVSGKIVAKNYRPGGYLNAALAKASLDNEANTLTIKTDKHELTCTQIAGLLARRIQCYVNEGDEVLVGQRYGFIRFGSRVDLYLPEDSEPRVAPGDIVSAGSDIVAWLPG